AHHQKTQLTTLTALINSYVFGVNPDLHFYSSLNCADDTTPQTDNLQLITPTDTSCVRVWGNSTYSELLETGGTITHPAQYVIEIEDPHLQTLTIYSSHTMSSETTPLTGANSETEN